MLEDLNSLIEEFIKSAGPYGPLAVILLQIVQVVIAFIPGEATGFISGVLYGPFWGTIYSTIGLTIGSALAFIAARKFGIPLVKKLAGEDKLEKYNQFVKDSGIVYAFILFVIPGFPKDFLSYALGVSQIRLIPFTIVALIGRLPGTIMLSINGHLLRGSVSGQVRWEVSLPFLLFSIIISIILYLNRYKITRWAEKYFNVS